MFDILSQNDLIIFSVFNTTVHEGASATILNNSTINCNSLDDIDSLGNIDMDSPDEQDTQ